MVLIECRRCGRLQHQSIDMQQVAVESGDAESYKGFRSRGGFR